MCSNSGANLDPDSMRKPPKNTQEMLPGYREYREEQEQALQRQHKELMALWQGGLTNEKLFMARVLIYCGLPVTEHKGKEPIVRKARLADGTTLRVTFIRTHPQVPLPYGGDRTMVYFITNKAVLQQQPILDWEDANEYLRLFRMVTKSGENHRAAQERFTRIAYMDIMVEHLDVNNKTVEHWKCPLIDHARISAVVDEEGNWKPSQSIGKMLEAQQSVSVGLRFFAELQKNPVPVPIALVHAVGKQFRILDYMIFLYWRAFAAHKESFIPWRYLQEQFDSADSNPRRWPIYFQKAKLILKALPDPINQIRFDVSSAGLTIYPLPVGTTFFEDHPKRGFRKELGALDSE
jgi:hypothetical protein